MPQILNTRLKQTIEQHRKFKFKFSLSLRHHVQRNRWKYIQTNTQIDKKKINLNKIHLSFLPYFQRRNKKCKKYRRASKNSRTKNSWEIYQDWVKSVLRIVQDFHIMVCCCINTWKKAATLEGVNWPCFEVSHKKWQFYSHFQIPWHITSQVTRIALLLRT